MKRVAATIIFLLALAAPGWAQPNDPYFRASGSWGQSYDDQWGLKRVGFTADAGSAWRSLGPRPAPVIVAVIDTGLDWNHLDFDWENIWRNPGEVPDNRLDDDGNGYVDDIIGWDFFGDGNNPWDHDGHGTFVSGIIAASTGNGIGIAGINPHARIMVLKALNSFGHTRASYVARAIQYAADHGARVINLSLGGPDRTELETAAIDYAASKGVIVVVASGNEGESLEARGPASHPGVITVASTGLQDERVVFSNWGPQVSIAAPGLDILGLRARRTDTIRDIEGTVYESGAAYVGDDRRYYRAGGTSFSAPLVTGVASLLLSKNPALTAEQVTRMILHSARDVDVPGRDQFTGYGLLDARAALVADPEFFIDVAINGVQVAQAASGTMVQVLGTAAADRFAGAWLELGQGESPASWKKVTAPLDAPVRDGVLGAVPAAEFAGAKVWTLRVITRHANQRMREAWFKLTLG
jgi:subtilisin family serine protease